MGVKNLSLRANLIQIWKTIGNKDGWDISKHKNLLLLKSPTMLHNWNAAIIDGVIDNPLIITEYFGNRPFSVLYRSSDQINFPIESKKTVVVREMELNLKNLENIVDHPSVKTVRTISELAPWCEVSGASLGYDKDEMLKLVKEIYLLNKVQLLYYEEEGKVLGTGLIHVGDNKLVYIASIGVLENKRRCGIGKKITQTCISKGKKLGGMSCALYSSQKAESLYQNLGFTEIAKWNFSNF